MHYHTSPKLGADPIKLVRIMVACKCNCLGRVRARSLQLEDAFTIYQWQPSPLSIQSKKCTIDRLDSEVSYGKVSSGSVTFSIWTIIRQHGRIRFGIPITPIILDITLIKLPSPSEGQEGQSVR